MGCGFDPHSGHKMKISFSSSTLKIIAMVTMVIDHIGLLFFPQVIFLRIIGRLAYPLFAFLIAEGHRRTSKAGAYLFRLFIFAIISQIPYLAFTNAANMPGVTLNIFFTLFAGLLALICFKKLPAHFSVPTVILICILAEVANFDYGAFGVLLILASSVFLHHRSLVGSVPFATLPLVNFLWIFHTKGTFSYNVFMSFSIFICAFYNGKNGIKLPRRLLYWFYPTHLFVLWLWWLLSMT